MTELGAHALLLVPFAAIWAGGISAAGALRGREAWVRSGERGVYAVFGLLTLAMIGLEVALVTDRFDIAFVAQISVREQPTLFKLALWGGHDGSLLLWAWMLAGMSALAVWQNRNRNRALVPWAITSLMANVLFFAVLLNLTSNPFDLVPLAERVSNGQGMNPLLQHPVMLIHPPILYVGFIGFAVPFSFAIGAMVSGELGTAWFRTTRRWTITAWFFLGIGIMLGGRWAYEVLGWGGYWAWDPVENSSLMPFLIGTAYVHSVMIQEKRGMLKVWNLALIGLTYTMCLFGTFLTRSGVVQSVHSFANSGWFGQLFLGYVLTLAGVFTALLIHRLPDLRSNQKLDSALSREASFLLNNYAFLALCGVVLFGTMYPVFSEAIEGVKVQIGPPFFQTLAGPLAVLLLLLTGIGPLIAWRRATWTNVRKSFLWPGVASLTIGALLLVFGMRRFYPWMFFTLCAFVTGTIVEEYARGIRARMRRGEGPARAFFELLRRNQRRYGGYIVHLSVVLMFVGFAGAAFDREETQLLAPGESWKVGEFEVEYRQVRPISHPHYAGAIARLALTRNGVPLGILEPEKRFYFQQDQPATLPAVSSTLREDFYVILTGIEPDQSVALKAYVNPLVNWIWIGGVVFVIGNTLLLWRIPAVEGVRPASGS